MATPSVEVRDLTKRYDGRAVVDHLTFDLQPGRITGFLGPNGAGKSTTMRCMVGLDRADEGSVLVGGRTYTDLPRGYYQVRDVYSWAYNGAEQTQYTVQAVHKLNGNANYIGSSYPTLLYSNPPDSCSLDCRT